MSERRRPFRRGRRSRPSGQQSQTPIPESYGDVDPYLDTMDSTSNPASPPADAGQLPDARDNMTSPAIPTAPSTPAPESGESTPQQGNGSDNGGAPPQSQQQSQYNPQTNQGGGRDGGGQGQGQGQREQNQHRDRDHRHNGRRGRNQRGRGRQRGGGGQGGGGGQQQQQQQQGPRGDQAQRAPLAPVVPDGETAGWFDPQREGGFVRRAANSYLAEPGDAYVPTQIMRQYALRRGDEILATTGHDHRNRVVVVDVQKINDADPAEAARRPDFGSLIASYPERKLKPETGRPA